MPWKKIERQFRFIINFRKKIRIESNSEERPAGDASVKETPESSGPDEDNDLAERIKKKSRGRPKKSNEIVVNIYLFLKVALSQKGLRHSSFLQTGKPNYFPELKFWILFPSKWLKSCQKRTLSCSNAFFDHSEELKVLFLTT